MKPLVSQHLLILNQDNHMVEVRCRCGRRFTLPRHRVPHQKSCGCLKSRAVRPSQKKKALLKRIAAYIDLPLNGLRIEVAIRQRLQLGMNEQVVLRHIKEVINERYGLNLKGRDINAFIANRKRMRAIIAILAEKPNTFGLKMENYLAQRLGVGVSRINRDLVHIKTMMTDDTQGNFSVPYADTQRNENQSGLPDISLEKLQQGIFSGKSGM